MYGIRLWSRIPKSIQALQSAKVASTSDNERYERLSKAVDTLINLTPKLVKFHLDTAHSPDDYSTMFDSSSAREADRLTEELVSLRDSAAIMSVTEDLKVVQGVVELSLKCK